jgi:excisionase family DNA binding protein
VMHATVAQTTYLTVAEVAEDLRVVPMTVYRMIHRGELTAICLGARTYRIPAGEYATYKAKLHADATARTRPAPVPHIPGQTEISA